MSQQGAESQARGLLKDLQPSRAVQRILDGLGDDEIDADLVGRVCAKLRREEDSRVQCVGVGHILRMVASDHKPIIGNVGYLLPPLLKTVTDPSLTDEVGEAVKFDAFRSMEKLLQLALRAELERFEVPLIDALHNRTSPLITGDSPSVIEIAQARSYCRCLTSLAVRLPSSREATTSRLLQYISLARPGVIDETCVDLEALMAADKDARGRHLTRWMILCLSQVEIAKDREDCDLALHILLKLTEPCVRTRIEFYLDDIVLRLLISFCRFGSTPTLTRCLEELRAASDEKVWHDAVTDVLERYGDEYERVGDFAALIRAIPSPTITLVS
ncbi:hypothetical protein FOL47_000428 [Perkinsus chesapeaki]|uniref:Uncharacterized protein n=1 Tax=Perkinsus chesapeaki TaxID=330153 RepID=A0A7J6MLQ2_PERCH|nr:hypothetical protein FOL47_000428 [Perkinsus chesapeaki]